MTKKDMLEPWKNTRRRRGRTHFAGMKVGHSLQLEPEDLDQHPACEKSYQIGMMLPGGIAQPK
jgi:hypothetical protein